ncbi:MAG: HAD-IB family phosphatase [Anaerovibrio sp.]|uniref:HAD-IB family phosphatase n=1 Tax=Anaerovibrio sp. TaxID=1872532 RepID=UPI0025D5DE02|nr:HAD-IB family phosphatase [Anaerovibrio sp.]MCR5177075.1 HAD-IB family phosphatase [Anaerovibrio sp.]
MTKFVFDLDGTITKYETLPLIAKHFQVTEQINELTRATVAGQVPFIESFIRRVYILGKLPASEINELLSKVETYDHIVDFIHQHREQCSIATGNLDCWIDSLAGTIGCKCFCSSGLMKNDKVVKLTTILKKEDIVKQFKSEGHRVVFIGDGNNDVEAMRMADVAIASGITHSPAPGAISVADYLVLNEVALCRQLNQLL